MTLSQLSRSLDQTRPQFKFWNVDLRDLMVPSIPVFIAFPHLLMSGIVSAKVASRFAGRFGQLTRPFHIFCYLILMTWTQRLNSWTSCVSWKCLGNPKLLWSAGLWGEFRGTNWLVLWDRGGNGRAYFVSLYNLHHQVLQKKNGVKGPRDTPRGEDNPPSFYSYDRAAPWVNRRSVTKYEVFKMKRERERISTSICTANNTFSNPVIRHDS